MALKRVAKVDRREGELRLSSIYPNEKSTVTIGLVEDKLLDCRDESIAMAR